MAPTQFWDTEKSPVVESAVMVRFVVPVLPIERERPSLVVTGVSAKVNDEGEKKTKGAFGVPDNPMSCGERRASSVITMLPD